MDLVFLSVAVCQTPVKTCTELNFDWDFFCVCVSLASDKIDFYFWETGAKPIAEKRTEIRVRIQRRGVLSGRGGRGF